MLSANKSESWTVSLIAALRQALGPGLENAIGSDIPGLVRIDLGAQGLKDHLTAIRTCLGDAAVDSFDDFFVFENGRDMEFIARFYSTPFPGREVRLGVTVKAGERVVLPSLSEVWPAARSCENEVRELFGWEFTGAESSLVTFSLGQSNTPPLGVSSHVSQAGGKRSGNS